MSAELSRRSFYVARQTSNAFNPTLPPPCRKVYPATPGQHYYEATAYSRTRKSVLAELSKWGEPQREKLKKKYAEAVLIITRVGT